MLRTQEIYTIQQITGIGDQTIRKLISNKLSSKDLYSEEKLQPFLPGKVSAEEFLQHFERISERTESEFEHFSDADIKVIGACDATYPLSLKTMTDYPVLLFCKGNTELLADNRNIAIIGTRENSDVGGKIAYSTAFHFSQRGYTIVSGLAKGIDAVAHLGALNAKGKTIAVLTDIGKIYPKENIELAEQIVASGGLLLAETKPGTFMSKSAFVQRDRIQSGLSLAIFPIETDIKGGTMHTVAFAKVQSRLIFSPDVNHPTIRTWYEKSVGYGFSKINGIKELISTSDAFAYTKDSYATVEEKLKRQFLHLTGKDLEELYPAATVSSSEKNMETTIASEVDPVLMEQIAGITQEITKPYKKLSKKDELMIEHTMRLKNDLLTLLSDIDNIISNLPQIQPLIEEYNKVIKKLMKSAGLLKTKPKESKPKKATGSMFQEV